MTGGDSLNTHLLQAIEVTKLPMLGLGPLDPELTGVTRYHDWQERWLETFTALLENSGEKSADQDDAHQNDSRRDYKGHLPFFLLSMC